MNSTMMHNRLRAGLAAAALNRAGDRAYSRTGTSPGMTGAFLDRIPEADIDRGLALLEQEIGEPPAASSNPHAKIIRFGNGAWLRNLRKPRVASMLERRAQRDMWIGRDILAGTPIAEAAEHGCADFARRLAIDAELARISGDADDDATRKAFEDYEATKGGAQKGAGSDLKAQIAEHEAFLAASRARNNAPPTPGPSIREALLKGDGRSRDREQEDEELWYVAIHEASHAVCAIYEGLKVESATANAGGNGECCLTTDSVSRATPEQLGVVYAAGSQGAYLFRLISNTVLQNHDERCDGPQFERVMGAGEAGNNPSEAAVNVINRVQFIVESQAPAIVGIAKILFDNKGRAVPGASCHAIYDFYEGRFDAELDEAATMAALKGEPWPWARGVARGLR